MPRLFVYGTLKRGGSNHARLAGQKFIAEAHTMPGYTLYSLGDYPGMIFQPADRHGVSGEIWEVDAETLAELDEFEGVPEGLYHRDTVPLLPPHAKAAVETYLYARHVDSARHIGVRWPG
jgi:gamma-glutamylaminecyclotransferase